MIRLLIASIFLFLVTNLTAQKHLILRSDGTQFNSYGQLYSNEVQPPNLKKDKKAIKQYYEDNKSITYLNKVLFYQFNTDVNFGFFGQDWLVQWFEAPGDMTINRAGFNVNAVDASGLTVALKLVTLNWTKPQIDSAGTTLWGYYPADGNGFGNATAFLDNPDRTGDWVDLEGSGMISPFGGDIWSDSGNGILSEAIPSGAVNVYQWTDMSELGNTPVVQRGSLVGVAVKNLSTTIGTDRIGILADNTLGIPGFKFYANGRTPGDTATAGWWTRDYTWDFALDVTFPEPPPLITNVTNLPTTLSTDDRTVNAEVRYDIVNVDLMYSIDSLSFWTSIPMTGTEPDFSGIIPGQQPGTQVDYFVTATDVNGNTEESVHFGYEIFQPTSTDLLVFNGFSTPTGYPQGYYFGQDDFINYTTVDWDHDVWSYGALTSEILDNYTKIIEIATNGRKSINNDAIRTWIEADPNHCYAAFGDEYIGTQTEWKDSTYANGDFFFDILGIKADHNDISYNGIEPVDGSVVYPVVSTVLGGPLLNKYNQVTTDSGWSAPLLYSPKYEIGINNWLDGVEFTSDVEVDMTADNFDGTANYAILGHRTLPAGNKIVFGSYDPLSLDSDIENEVEYYWYGFSYSAPQVTTIVWFGIVSDVNQIGTEIPEKFVLSQNYPNPFNPATTIKYSLPVRQAGMPANFGDSDIHRNDSRIINLKIYDVLGQEIRTLVNEKQSPGNYQVQFDASGLPSGVYIYRLQAGNFNQSKKMILLR